MNVIASSKTESEKVFYFEDEWIEAYNGFCIGDTGLKGTHITVIEKDEENRVWVGTTNKGLLRFEKDFFTVTDVLNNGIRRINDLELDYFQSRFFLATNNGLAIFENGGHRVSNHADGLSDNHVMHLQLQNQELILSTERGFSIFDLRSYKYVNGYDHLSRNHIYCTEAFDGCLYIGTLNGLKVFRDGKLLGSYDSTNSSLTHEWITAFSIYKGNLFVGTYGGGVYILEQNQDLVSLRKVTKSCEVNFNAMCSDKHNIYIGTLAHGLFVLDPVTFSIIQITRGLLSPNVTALYTDETHLYVGTENGINRVQKRNLIFS